MKQMINPQVPDWAEANKPRVTDFLQFLDSELKDRPYVAGACCARAASGNAAAAPPRNVMNSRRFIA